MRVDGGKPVEMNAGRKSWKTTRLTRKRGTMRCSTLHVGATPSLLLPFVCCCLRWCSAAVLFVCAADLFAPILVLADGRPISAFRFF